MAIWYLNLWEAKQIDIYVTRLYLCVCVYIIYIYISVSKYVYVYIYIYIYAYLYLSEHKNCYEKDYTNHVHFTLCYIRFIEFAFCPENEKKTTIPLEKTFCS